MKRTRERHLPKMRQEGLIVNEMLDEILVYDLDRHKAHCLNGTAAMVWRQCDGKTSPREIAHRLQLKLARPIKENLVWLALRQLEKTHLLAESPGFPPEKAGISRRDMVRALGIAAAVSVPVITSIVSPTAVQAASCLPAGQACSTGTQCCSNVCNVTTCL